MTQLQQYSMPFSARISSVFTVSLSAGLSQPRGALPAFFLMVPTTSLISLRSCAGDCLLINSELVRPWPIHSQPSLLPSSTMRG